ncbi:hypothetical protein HAX54_031092, partial [Datura stramonium]|nr:hypothetical protein [Datura stramonium]
MAPNFNKGKGVASSSYGKKGQEWVKKHKMRILACHNNHHGDMDSIESWEEPSVELGQVLRIPLMMMMLVMRSKLELTPIWSLMV